MMCSVSSGGGSGLEVSYVSQDKEFSNHVYFIEWPTEIPITVNAYGGYNAQECENFTEIRKGMVGVYFSNLKPTKFYFSMESGYESRAGESEYVDSTLLTIQWLTQKGVVMDTILDCNNPNLQVVTNLVKDNLQEDTEPTVWIGNLFSYLKEKEWISEYCNLANGDDEEEDGASDSSEESS